MDIEIIGGGIQGLSTGIVLEHLGYETRIRTKSISYIDSTEEPTVSSNIAAASIYPVEVDKSDYSLAELIDFAESTFEPFYAADSVPVRKHTHYYLGENPVTEIETPNRMNAHPVEEHSAWIPERSGKTVDTGYVCDEYFVEMPEYIPLLYDTYTSIGGTVIKEAVDKPTINRLNETATVVNCSGYGSKFLFSDHNMRAVKGHILELPYDGSEPLPFSYTYVPNDYSEYTYMYPRKDKILLGGSYLRGELTMREDWVGESMEKPIEIDGENVPERLVAVNEDLLEDHRPFTRNEIHTTFGYRPYRESGIRNEADENGVLHNYGHGGSGVSMSWWSAVNTAELLTDVSDMILPDVAELLSKQT